MRQGMNTQPQPYFITPRYDRGPPTDPLELDLSVDAAQLASKIRRELLRQKLSNKAKEITNQVKDRRDSMATNSYCYDKPAAVMTELLSKGIPATEAEAEAKMDYLRRIYASGQEPETTASMRSDGSTASYYQLPTGATELQDLISYRNMNAQDGEIFRAIYRKGRASHSDELRDARKVLFYAQAEVKRLEQVKTTGWQGVK